MRVLGINKGRTLSGKRLRFGGAAIYDDGEYMALGEERASRIKYAGGYVSSLRTVLAATGKRIEADFDYIAVSTCCEAKSAALLDHELAGHERLVAIQHHLSHASLAYFGSGFDTTLVVVADGGGNTLVDTNHPIEVWWQEPREQCSYYLGNNGRLELVGQDFDQPFDVGLGEIYRAFTYFLGWHSSTHASKTMALAGHGRRGGIRAELFEFTDGRLSVPVKNDPTDPVGMINRLGDVLGVDFGEPRAPNQAILRIHRDVAAFAQRSLEDALLRRLAELKRQLGVNRVCIAGGIAHNVVLNGRLFELFPEGVYVPSAPGDEGQCLGNIYALLAATGIGSSLSPLRNSSSACLGPPMQIDSAAVTRALADAGLSCYVVIETTDFSDLIADFLASGDVVCLYQSSSEFGPRALGSRSILADPRREDVVFELNTLKQRGWFMPFAPTVLRSRMDEWFLRAEDSPFMSFALRVRHEVAAEIPAVVNADGTSRVQTVEEDDQEPITRILTSFANRTGVPVLLNTSFNLGGEPIVESIPQALATFRDMPVNVLGIGRFVIVKAMQPASADFPIEGSIGELELRVRFADSEARVETKARSISAVVRRLQSLTKSVVFVRTELPLYGPYLGWLREGRKVTTIRFRKGAIEIPFSTELPLFETIDYSPGDRTSPTDYVKIGGIRYQRFGELRHADAQRDGFDSLPHLRRALREIYPSLDNESWVSVYDISLAGP
jgi:carbamoyltransferase